MTTWQKIVSFSLAAIVLIVVWMGRYEMQSVPTGGQGNAGVAYVLDRWTGKAYSLLPTAKRELREPAL